MSELYNELGDFSKIKDEIDNWTLKPVSIDKASPMEMTELNSGYAVEQFQWEFYHKALEMTPDRDMQKLFARISFEEEEHLSKIGSAADPNMTPMESGLGLQMTAIQGFSEAAQLETNAALKDTYDYILLDHLTLMKMLSDTSTQMGTKGSIYITYLVSFLLNLIPGPS